MIFREMLDFVGIEKERITFSWVSAAEGARWAEVVNTTVDKVKEMGPYNAYRDMVNRSVEEEVKDE
jgi:coenzyme F420-reducing hydrogenase delta subunit